PCGPARGAPQARGEEPRAVRPFREVPAAARLAVRRVRPYRDRGGDRGGDGEGAAMSALLEVEELRTYFAGDGGEFRAVDGVSFSVGRGRTLGIVGESGCGKSVTSLSIMWRVPQPPGRVAGRSVMIEVIVLLQLDIELLSDQRRSMLSVNILEPMTS